MRFLIKTAMAIAALFIACGTLQAASIKHVALKDMDATVRTLATPALVLVESDDCQTCATTERFLEQISLRQDLQMTYVVVTGSNAFGRPEWAPYVAISIPGSDVYIYAEPAFQPKTISDAESFVVARSQAALAIIAAKAKYNDLLGEMDRRSKPFEAKLALLQPQHNTIAGPFDKKIGLLNDRIRSIREQATKATSAINRAYEDDMYSHSFGTGGGVADRWLNRLRREQRLAPITAPFEQRIKPLQERIASLESQKQAALGKLEAQYKAISAEEGKVTDKLWREINDAHFDLQQKFSAEKAAADEAERNHR
jgi:hypothetical protein